MVSLLSVPWVLSQDGNQERSAQESAGKRQRSTKLVHKGINTEKGKLPVAPGEKLGLGLEGARGVEAVSRHVTVEVSWLLLSATTCFFTCGMPH